MVIMSQASVSRTPSPAASLADFNDDWTLYPYDSSISTQDADNDESEEELDSLRRSEAVIAQQYLEFLTKNNEIDLAKEQEQLSEFEAEIKELREATDIEPGERELKLLLAKIFMKRKQKKQVATGLGESQTSPEVAQDTTEAEVEELQHVRRASEQLKNQDNVSTQRKLELIRQVQGCMAKLEELEISSGNNAQQCMDTIPLPELSFSAVTTGAYVAPIEVKDEIEELIEHLSTVEIEKDLLITHLTHFGNAYRKLTADFDTQVERIQTLRDANLRLNTRNENLASQLEAQTQLLRAKDQETEQQIAQVKAELTGEYQARIDALEAERPRTYSIFSDPEFVASLWDSDASSTVPCSNPCCTGSAAAAAPAPNTTLHITLEPNDTGLWSLLRHVQRTAFWTTLHVEGPERLVQEFFASIEQADREFEDQARRLARLERTIMQNLEMLRLWLG